MNWIRGLFFAPEGIPSRLFMQIAIGMLVIWVAVAVIFPLLLAMLSPDEYPGQNIHRIGRSWLTVQEVWDRWQTLNTGMLAFLASYIAISATRLSEVMAARRNLRAAMPALTHTLSGLSKYVDRANNYLLTLLGVHERVPGSALDEIELSEKWIAELSEIVRFGPEPIAEFVSRLIIELQVFHSRIKGIEGEDDAAVVRPMAVYDNAYFVLNATVIRARLGYLFGFARGEIESFRKDLTRQQIVEAFPMFFEKPDGISEDHWEVMLSGTVRRANEPLSYAVFANTDFPT